MLLMIKILEEYEERHLFGCATILAELLDSYRESMYYPSEVETNYGVTYGVAGHA